MNQEIRNELHSKFLEQFSQFIKSLTNEKAKEIEENILECFIKAILGENSAYLNNALEDRSKNFISKITGHIAHNDGKFDYLVERFSRNVFDLMISYPLGA